MCLRKSCLLKLQRHLHELLMDQLPVLRQLARVLDEMALGVNSAAAAAGGAGSRLILEQVRACSVEDACVPAPVNDDAQAAKSAIDA
jgi:hypothetical protein